MKFLKVWLLSFSVFLLAPVKALEESLIFMLMESLSEEANTADYANLFKNCAAANNALLNVYKDKDRSNDDALLEVIEEQSEKSARFVEFASIFALEAENEDVRASQLARGIAGGASVDSMISIFDEGYYGMLRYYEKAAQNQSLNTVRISRSETAFVTGIELFIDACDEAASKYSPN